MNESLFIIVYEIQTYDWYVQELSIVNDNMIKTDRTIILIFDKSHLFIG